MTNNNSTRTLINGFEPVTVIDIERATYVTGQQSDALVTFFRTIARLTDDVDIRGLCESGELQAEMQANDIDALRYRATKAGLATRAEPIAA